MPYSTESHIYCPAEEAVADAMMVTQAEIMLPLVGNNHYSTEDFEIMLRDNSKNLCGRASIFALAYLSQKYTNLYDYMIIMASFKSYERLFKNRALNHHAFFLTKDKEGTWYATSPANHNPEAAGGQSPMTKIIKDRSLASIISTIEKHEGGMWPDADFIEHNLRKHYAAPKVLKGPDSYLEVCIVEYRNTDFAFYRSNPNNPLMIPKELRQQGE